MSSKKPFEIPTKIPENINISNDEMKRLENCLKDKKFRDLLSDYCREISNPKTKLAYEQYLTELEQHGNAPKNKKLMKPNPSFCIKIYKNNDNNEYIYINICVGKLVKDSKIVNSNGNDHKLNSSGNMSKGLMWSIPYILGQERYEYDKKKCINTYDIAFSQNTIDMTSDNHFRNIVIQTGIEAIEKQYNMDLNHSEWNVLNDIKNRGDIPIMSVAVNEPDRWIKSNNKDKVNKSKLEIPKYRIVESGEINLSDYWEDKTIFEPNKRPNELIVYVKMNKINKGIKNYDVRVNVKKSCKEMGMIVRNYYILNVKLPYKCDGDSECIGIKWNKNSKELRISLKVKGYTKDEINEMKKKYNEIRMKRIERNEDINDTKNDDESETIQSKCDEDSKEAINDEMESNKNIKKIKPIKDFTYDYREKFDKFVLIFRVKNIISDTLSIKFKETYINIGFETNDEAYFKKIELYGNIQPKLCNYDLNDRNLLIKIVKQRNQMWNVFELKDGMKRMNDNINDDINDILNDPIMLEME